MKFTTSLVFGLCILVASCSAACSCSSSDQGCMDKCVLAANSCIVQCKDGGDACQKACISSHWPASPISQKDVLADVSSTVMPSMTSGSSVPTESHSASVHVYSTTSGGSAIMVTSTMKPSATSSRMPSATSTKTDGASVGNSAGVLSRQMTPMVTMAGVMAIVSWIL